MQAASSGKLRVIFLEDAPNDFNLVQRRLSEGGLPCDLIRVESCERFLKEIASPPDLILSDHHLPEFDGYAALDLSRKKCPEVPFIFVTGCVSESEINKALQRGASDILAKQQLATLLIPAIRRARELANERALRQQAEAALRRRTADLEETERELEALSYSISHDLRAPLRHIDGFADLLRQAARDKLDDASKEYLDIITASARQLNELIEAVRSFSRLARTPLNAQPVSLRKLLDGILHDFRYEMEERHVEWQVGSLPEVNGDPTLLRLVLVNLLSNGLKFTRPRIVTKIEIGATESAADHIVHIKDNGVGFDMEFAGKLFGVFQRLHSSTEFEGVGVGLASVRRIVQRHGGRTWAEAAPDQGATFYFSLPKNRSH
jgi:signal transduction histidine kinase